MDCKDCNRVVPYIVHEADMSRLERTIHRMWALVAILIVTLVLTNVGWIMYSRDKEATPAEAYAVDQTEDAPADSTE